MIDVKQAVRIAKEKAADMLDQASFNLEEIGRDSYKGRDVWSITLSLPRYVKLQPSLFSPVAEGGPLQYRRFLIDVETGELVAMKLREVATR
ncbi:MAG: hypothetical protein ACLQU1_07675 [Bryobacteraceae bacterium]